MEWNPISAWQKAGLLAAHSKSTKPSLARRAWSRLKTEWRIAGEEVERRQAEKRNRAPRPYQKDEIWTGPSSAQPKVAAQQLESPDAKAEDDTLKARLAELERELIDARWLIENLESQLRAPTVTPPRSKSSSRRPRIEYDPNRPSASSGSSVAFSYVDSDGELTDRDVVNWRISGRHLRGFCLLRAESRTFLLNRVIEWREWD